MNLEESMTDVKSFLMTSIIGAIGMCVFIAALAGVVEWPRLLVLALGVLLMWISTLLGPMAFQWESARSGQVKSPWWLPPVLRPMPRRLDEARTFTMAAFGEDLRWANKIAGWLHPDHASGLCHLARICPNGAIVEIGSFRGKSTVFLARGMKPTNTLTAIDPHVMPEARKEIGWKRCGSGDEGDTPGKNINTSWNSFNRTLRQWNIADKVTVVKDYSHNVRSNWSEPIAFLWIDGDHRYDAVKQDIEDWVDLVMPGGFLAFHDTQPDQGEPAFGNVRSAIMDTGVLTKRGFTTYLELRNAWFMQRRSGK